MQDDIDEQPDDEAEDVLALSRSARKARSDSLPRCTILVLGKAGVGKSTLLNAVFGTELAKTGIGRRITPHLRAYRIDGVPVTIIDSRGIEIGDDLEDFLEEVLALVNERATGPDDERVHIVWFCTDSGGHRLLESEERCLRRLSEGPEAPTSSVIVATKFAGFDEDKQYVSWLRDQALPGPVVAVLAKEMRSPIGAFPATGLDELLTVTEEVLPVGRARAFENAQRVRLEAKQTGAEQIVDEYVDGVPLRTSIGDLVIGKELREAAEQAARRIVRMVGEVAAEFGSTSVPDSALDEVLREALGGTKWSDVADQLATAIGVVAGLIGSWEGPVSSRISKGLAKLASGKVLGAIGKTVDAIRLRSSEQRLTRGVGEAAIETFCEVFDYQNRDEEMSAGQVGAFFQRAFERAMHRQ